VRLALPVKHQTRFGFKPFGTFDAIMSPEAGQVLGSLGLFVLLEVFWRQQIGLDLVHVAVKRGQ
jgi:hypothetical protein